MFTPTEVRRKLNELKLTCRTPASVIVSHAAAREWANHGITFPAIRSGISTIAGVPFTVDRNAVGIKFLNESGEVIGEIN